MQFTGEVVIQRNSEDILPKQSRTRSKTLKIMQVPENPLKPDENPLYYVYIYAGNTEEVLFKFSMDQLLKIHGAFISQGKSTLEVSDPTPTKSAPVMMRSDISLREAMRTQPPSLVIMISNVSPEILTSFCKKLIELKSKKPTGATPDLKDNNKPTTSTQETTNPKPTLNRQNSQTDSQKFQMTKINRKFFDDENKPIENSSQENSQKFGVVRRNASQTSFFQDSSSQNGKRAKLNKPELGSKRTTKDVFRDFPDHLIVTIFHYLKPSELLRLNLVSKHFNKITHLSRRRLDFRGNGDIPPYVLTKFLNTSKNIKRLCMGKCKMLNQKLFLDDLKLDFKQLTHLDLADLTQLTDKMVAKFCYNCKSIQDISIPYYSKVTDEALFNISSLLPAIQRITLKSRNKQMLQPNDKLTDTNLAKVIKNTAGLEKFSIYWAGSSLLTKAFEAPLTNLKILKIDLIRFDKREDMKAILAIANLTSLTTFKLGNIVVKSPLGFDYLERLNDVETLIFQELFKKLTNLNRLVVGLYFNNMMARAVGEKIQYLEKLKIKSQLIDDNDISVILANSYRLVELDISNCRSVTGYCLENLVSPYLQKITVKLDEYREKGINNLLLDKGMLRVKVVNVFKK